MESLKYTFTLEIVLNFMSENAAQTMRLFYLNSLHLLGFMIKMYSSQKYVLNKLEKKMYYLFYLAALIQWKVHKKNHFMNYSNKYFQQQNLNNMVFKNKVHFTKYQNLGAYQSSKRAFKLALLGMTGMTVSATHFNIALSSQLTKSLKIYTTELQFDLQ